MTVRRDHGLLKKRSGIENFSTQTALDITVRQIIRIVDEIQTHSAPTIQRCSARFLEETNDPEDREYSEDADQIREVLIHAHYLSQKDIEICAAFDIDAKFDTHTNFPGIEALHHTLLATYTEPEDALVEFQTAEDLLVINQD